MISYRNNIIKNSEITTFILSCGRMDLLSRCITSYCGTLKEATPFILFDDSANRDTQAYLLKNYKSFDLYLNTEKWGQARALDYLIEKGLNTTKSEFIVLLEDDWVFIDKDWLSDCKKILRGNPEVMLIGLSIMPDHIRYGAATNLRELSGVKVYDHPKWRISPNHGYWNGWTSACRLMRRSDVEKLPNFSNYVCEEKVDQEYWRPLSESGRKSIWLARPAIQHIGYGRSLFPTGDRLSPEQRTWLKSWGKL